MTRKLLTCLVAPAAVTASLLLGEPAGAQFPGPPPGPPPMLRPPGPPPMMGPPGPPATRPQMAPTMPQGLRPAGSPPAAAPRGPQAPSGWTPPGVLRNEIPPAANLPGRGAAAGNRNIFAGRPDNVAGDFGRRGDGFAGGWKGLSRAANRFEGIYDRERARDGLDRWSWAARGGWGSGGYRSYGNAYGDAYGYSDSFAGDGYGSAYPAEAAEQAGSRPGAESQSYLKPSAESDSPEETDSDRLTDALQHMDQASSAFRQGDYFRARNECERALRLEPGNSAMREFRALCAFAQGNRDGAAADLHSVLAEGPGWNWKTLISFYSNPEGYTAHLRALEAHAKERPEDAAGRFVLAYHYLVLDERDAASRQLTEVVRLQPDDQVAAGILTALERARDRKDQVPAPQPTP